MEGWQRSFTLFMPSPMEEVCQPKDSRGLGVSDLKQMIRALLGRWLLKIFHSEGFDVEIIIRHLYYLDHSIFQNKAQAMSQFCRNICQNLSCFMGSTSVTVGDGQYCAF